MNNKAFLDGYFAKESADYTGVGAGSGAALGILGKYLYHKLRGSKGGLGGYALTGLGGAGVGGLAGHLLSDEPIKNIKPLDKSLLYKKIEGDPLGVKEEEEYDFNLGGISGAEQEAFSNYLGDKERNKYIDNLLALKDKVTTAGPVTVMPKKIGTGYGFELTYDY